jgi:ABC-2 type transport system permease protein
MTAGLAIQATRNLASLPIRPWSGVAVLAGYATAAMPAGTIMIVKRDA